MKILAFTDMHGRISILEKLRKKAAKCDIVVCCGDFTTFENEMGALLKMMSEFGKEIVLVNGNHEDEIEVERACKQFKNIHFIHGTWYKFRNFIFFGHGGGGFMNKDPEFEVAAKTFKKEIKPGKKAILVTHGPPYGTLLDLIDDDHVGCQSYTSFIEKNKIPLHLCGHLHENFKVIDEYKERTAIINPGPDGMIIEI